MNQPVTELVRESALLDLFEREYASWLAAGTPPGTSPGSSAALAATWKRALRDPIREFLARPGKQFRARLLQTSWLLAGGAEDGPPPELQMMIEVLHAGSLIVDDIQDGSEQRRGAPALHHLVGVPLAINTGNLLYCWTLELLTRAKLAPECELALHRRTSQAMLACHQGQALDLAAHMADVEPEEVPALVQCSTELKAGSLMELAAELGAIAAIGSTGHTYSEAGPRDRPHDLAHDRGPRPGQAPVRGAGNPESSLARFGRSLGVALQMLDDLSGYICARRREKTREDLRHLRPTWAWSWLSTELDRSDFQALQRRARRVSEGDDPEGLIDDIGQLLAECGREHVHEHLLAALEPLAQEFAGGPQALHFAALRAEVERLEQSYV